MKNFDYIFLIYVIFISSLGIQCGRVPNPDFTLKARSISFVNATYAWVILQDGKMLCTKDGGAHWDSVTIDGTFSTEQLYFINEKSGWAVNRSGRVWKTEDGGQAWSLQSILSDGDSSLDFPPVQVFFIDNAHGWVLSAVSLWKTENGGKNWRRFDYRIDLPQVYRATRCYFVNHKVGWMTGINGMSFKTQDGGETWESISVASDQEVFDSIIFVNERMGWINGWPNSGIYKTENGGKTWHQQLPQIAGERNIRSVHFVDKNNGWAVGFGSTSANKNAGSQGIVLQTANGGGSWNLVDISVKETFFGRVHFADTQKGWLLAPSTLYRTDDGGLTWHSVLKL